MSALKTGALITSGVFVIGGSVIEYYTVYRGSNVGILGMGMLFLGWFVILLAIGSRWLDKNEIRFQDDRIGWAKQKIVNGSIYAIFIVALFGNWLGIEKLSYKRVNYILNYETVLPSIATVTNLEETRGRSSTTYTAYITYNTTSGFIYQRLDNKWHQYFTGEELNVKYSVKHPNMFYVVSKVVDTTSKDRVGTKSQ